MKITKLSTITAALSASLFLAPGLMAADAPAAAPAPSAAAPAPAAAASPAAAAPAPGSPADWRQRMNDRMKTALKATDDEWTVIQPLLQKVMELQRSTRGGFGGGGFGGGGGRRGGGQNGGGNSGGAGGENTAAPAAAPAQPQSPTEVATAALRTALDADATTPDDIKTKLAALRDARKKAAADLDAARADLQKVLTLHQEAVLVNMGILE